MSDLWNLTDEGAWRIVGRECLIEIARRPQWCDRGHWLATLEARGELARDIDASDRWPRYYFDLPCAKSECEAWLRRRGQMPLDDAEGHDAAGHVIDKLSAYIAVIDSGEGIAAFQDVMKGVWMPMVGADDARIASLRPMAQAIAKMSGQKVVLARFSEREDIDIITPDMAAFETMVQGGKAARP